MKKPSKFSNGSYCHGNLEVLQSYAEKVHEKISLKYYVGMIQPIFLKASSSGPSNGKVEELPLRCFSW